LADEAPLAAARAVLAAARAALAAGQVVGLPTDTVYGLAAAPLVPGATDRVFAIKRRPPGLDLPVLVGGVEQARSWAGSWPDAAARLADAFWPGALTIVVARRTDLARVALGGQSDTVGLRWPDHPVPVELCRRLGPLATTSANLHGQPALTTAAAVRETFAAEVPVVIDAGVCAGAPSTVVACTDDGVRLLREGRIPWADVAAVAGGR
jgi:L-threonylcarbamoyladenylate synthase